MVIFAITVCSRISKSVEAILKKKNQSLVKYASAPFTSNYRPEIDVSAELNASDASYYQSLIGILHWIVELGRPDITCEVSMMASMMALPRIGHLEQFYHIFAYLKRNHNAEMFFDPTVPDHDESLFQKHDWSHTIYSGVEKELPENAPTTRGIGFTISACVDSDHAGDSVTRRSRTVFIVKLNNSPIYWMSKKQS